MNKQTEQNLKLLVAIVSLFGLLTYTWVHTSALLARYVHPWYVAYIAAFSIEIAIAGMTWRLARKQGRSTFLLFALIAALTISAGANVYEGYVTRYGEQLTIDKLGQIDPIQAIIGLSATALISLMVFAISDIIGDDVVRVTRQTESKKRAEQKERQPEQLVKQAKQQPEQGEYKSAIFKLLANKPELGPTAIANEVKCSKATASKWANAYKQNGSG